MRGFHPPNSLPLWQQAPKRELLLLIVVLIIITLNTSIVLFLFMIINRDPRAKVLPRIRNRRWRIKGFHLMHRRVRKTEPSCHVLSILFLHMYLLSQSLTIGITLSSIFAEHVEASKQTLGNEV
jgi:hypothetical protein